MKLQQICPFARYVRYIFLNPDTKTPPFIPLDSRLFYVKSGMGRIEIDGNIINLEEGKLVYIKSGTSYQHLPCSVTYLAVNFDFTDNFAHLETPVHNVNLLKPKNYKILEEIDFEDAHCFNSFYIFSECKPLLNILTLLEKEFTDKLPFYRVETSALLKLLLSSIARNAEKSTVNGKRFNTEEIISYIQKNYSQPLSNEHLSKVFHYHPNYLSAEFKRRVGLPIHKYILETRILKAASMLESSNCSINSVALSCGFTEINYFSRYFKKILGVSPTKFINSNK